MYCSFFTIVHLTWPERARAACADKEVGRRSLVADGEVGRRCSWPTRTMAAPCRLRRTPNSSSAASAGRSASSPAVSGAGRQNSSSLVRRERGGVADVLLRPERPSAKLLVRRERRRAGRPTSSPLRLLVRREQVLRPLLAHDGRGARAAHGGRRRRPALARVGRGG